MLHDRDSQPLTPAVEQARFASATEASFPTHPPPPPPPPPLSTSAPTDTDPGIELVPLRSHRVDKQAHRRAEKRRWLQAQDEMKFSHSLQFNAVPDWSSHYIAYSNLKKLIYQLEKTVNQAASHQDHGDAESRPLISNEPNPEAVFSRALDVELEKICSFYVLKERELLDEVDMVLHDVGALSEEEEVLECRKNGSPVTVPSVTTTAAASAAGPSNAGSTIAVDDRSSTRHSSDDGDSDDDHQPLPPLKSNRRRLSWDGPRRRHRSRPTTAVTNLAASTDLTASTEFTRSRRYSTTFEDAPEDAVMFSSSVMLKKRIVHTYVQLCELKSYVQLNKTGFRKVLKKFDKILDTNLRPAYMAASVEPAFPFRSETWDALLQNITRMEAAYTDVVTGGDAATARRDLRSHLREHVVWERNTVWRDMIGIERRAEAASLGGLAGRGLGGGGLGLMAAGSAGGGSDDDDAKNPRRPGARLRQGDDMEPQALPVRRIRLLSHVVVVPAWLVSSSMLTLVTVVAVFFGVLYAPGLLDGLPEQQNCLAMLVFVSLLWATEAIPLFVTSLMVPFLCVVLRVACDDSGTDQHRPRRMGSKEAAGFIFAAMWTPVIMLLLGGFTLAAALSKCRIDKRLATFVLSKAGTQPRTVLLANMFVAAFASMLISNVAAPVLCFGIIEPMLRNLPSESNMSKALIIGIALASNIGGMLSPIASPQNVVAIGIMTPEPPWLQWFFIAIPVGVVSILLIWLLLLVSFRPGRGTTIVAVRPVRERFTAAQWFVTLVTLVTIGLWCASHNLEDTFGDMGVVAILPIVIFFGIGILSKEDFNNFPWTIIILAAGGLALGKAVKASGLLDTVAAGITVHVQGMSLYGVLVVFSTLILVIATFISHTVAALILLPLVHNIGADMAEPHPNLLVMAGVLMCSAAMGLPTSGFPNMTAIMKEDPAGQRYLRVKHFITRGIPSSLITLVVVLTIGFVAMRVTGM
ncbi:plasma membrane phosphate transporter [Grosmannia clavigera kw1407]|uniref:Plasma membrane phosphate transporter n=1 Tax=Grosmannia clavigera (strain kw1407 / UAMH 11150) TaxID=655863 RepID=F0X6I5_GROCL|nr:plasma membrane phosphate transporter [Grosmannia clavigera kw1407]EFX06461.1 plasma membrane phosphate transporter [Grosmannia clavigera kw1407]